ncbi:bifunctional 3-deoxy-7-phosphoheptulonate synthase/chorismate mutase type II [Pontibacter harenae]|uniref:bifunctional 3-deoxy-7-phosphoheptulonate synthase/chorismate mutase type II n=1 Tax=Pontibacter harenae TaxID=2894083 RepID=UPI001E2DD743|nr:bifunctional 3-deoxy-7-phosphoheptulonate synthase/chorismate mutase type II [Pontibacter harenae]MCC9167143.1 bifunctional 3-deoxy-7-phosphoheptulonate synthase/chorismate mutase type II [Pontibacter harenae]
MNTSTTMKLCKSSSTLAKTDRPVIIAGPCSAESEEQMLKTALGLQKLQGLSVFRAGIWKPRTRPGHFQGVGTVGLEWLKTVKQETGLRTACEVAHAKHVTEALQHGVDILIIGAHTTVNSFLVQDIADALQGVDVPVLVKNPVNPDLMLWIGALERLHHSGIKDLGVVHRGFSTMDNAPYRNHPKWDHVVELRKVLPEIPVYCDSSHIAGRRSLLRPVSQRALNLDYDGLMVEAHYNPALALSDAQQQLMPQELDMLLQTLDYNIDDADSARKGAQLEELRKYIEHLDDELLDLIARRSRLSAKLNDYMDADTIEAPQVVQWDHVLGDLLVHANSAGVNKEFVQTIFQEVRKHYAQTYLYKA